MEFYSSICAHYEYIFPYNPMHLSFIESLIEDDSADVDILDIGCSTGALAFKMAEKNWSVFAIDADKEMIDFAQHKKEQGQAYPVFKHMLMQNASEVFQTESFNHVVCFGNTLVHLDNLLEVDLFLEQVFNLLLPEGKLSLQILNYAHVLETKIPNLPLIDNNKVKFERFYHYDDSSYVNFETRLSLKSNLKSESIQNNILLFPITLDQLLASLNKIGFKDIQYYSNFKKDVYQTDSLSLVVTARK